MCFFGNAIVYFTAEPESGPDIDPPSFTKELTDMTAKEGDTITMKVTITGEDYDVEWFKNAVDVVEGDRISIVNNGDGKHALVISNVEDDDTGEYCCVATNDGGRATCAGYFTVHGKRNNENIQPSLKEMEVIYFQKHRRTFQLYRST